MLGFLPSSGFQRYTLNSRVPVAPRGFGHVLPPVIFEFLGSANSTMGASDVTCRVSTCLACGVLATEPPTPNHSRTEEQQHQCFRGSNGDGSTQVQCEIDVNRYDGR